MVHMARLRKELFSPSSLTNIKTSSMHFKLAKMAAKAIYDEMRDESKATFKYLSVLGSKYSWNGFDAARKKPLLGKKATNNEAESAVGGTTENRRNMDKSRFQVQEQSVTLKETNSYSKKMCLHGKSLPQNLKGYCRDSVT